ncbi:hypothetical protein HMPREF9554_03036, partial [Treponema phagedenis F0421]
ADRFGFDMDVKIRSFGFTQKRWVSCLIKTEDKIRELSLSLW